MGRRRSRVESPIEEAVIRDLNMAGQGVTETDGKAAFVDTAITGERVRFQRRRRRKNYDEAELVEILEPSPDRVDPPCEYFGTCGGCSLQHVSPEAQLRIKQGALTQAFDRIGQVAPAELLPPLAGEPLGYRRRARVGVKHVAKKGRVLVGFREKRKHYVADMRNCQTLAPPLAALLVPLSDLIGQLTIAAKLPQVEMSLGDSSLSLVIRVLDSPTAADQELLRDFGAAHNATIYLQTGGPATVAPLADSSVTTLAYALPEFGLQLEFGPLDFIQVNQDMNRRMLSQALTLLGPLDGLRVMDLFCGIGNFTLPLATGAASVTGVELDTAMVAKARANAALNNISNVDFHAADLAADDVSAAAWWGDGFDLVVLDPPRAGALEALPGVAATGAKRILYISCHPASLARDAGVLVNDYGYQLKSAGAMDMFPQTGHVEAMALFER